MKFSIVKTACVAIGLLLSTGLAMSGEPESQKVTQTKSAGQVKASARSAKAEAKVELVDINSATKKELKKLPGISDADADKIIAGRPYLSKAHLQTHNIVSPMVYQGLRQLVIARQKETPVPKPVKK